jgi:hypothetical protein
MFYRVSLKFILLCSLLKLFCNALHKQLITIYIIAILIISLFFEVAKSLEFFLIQNFFAESETFNHEYKKGNGINVGMLKDEIRMNSGKTECYRMTILAYKLGFSRYMQYWE